MNISEMMGRQLAELQQTLSMNLLKSQMATQTAAVTTMIEDINQINPKTIIPHPHLGNNIDTKA